MSNRFFYNKTFQIIRYKSNGGIDKFTVEGMVRMNSVLDQQNGNVPASESFFILSAGKILLPGDNIIFDNCNYKIGKVEPIFDLDGKLQAYKVESL